MTAIYKKTGRRYVPCGDTDALNGLRNGKWLVIVENGRRTVRALLDTHPMDVALEAVLATFASQLADALVEANQSQPGRSESIPLTAKEKRAYRAYMDVMGKTDGPLWFYRRSARDVAEAAIEKFRTEVSEHAKHWPQGWDQLPKRKP